MTNVAASVTSTPKGAHIMDAATPPPGRKRADAHKNRARRHQFRFAAISVLTPMTTVPRKPPGRAPLDAQEQHARRHQFKPLETQAKMTGLPERSEWPI